RIGVLTTSGERRVVLEGGSYARYAPTGHLVYARGGDIMAVPFDVRRLAVSGEPAAVTHGGMLNTLSGVAHFGISRTGLLVKQPGTHLVAGRHASGVWSRSPWGSSSGVAPR